MYYKITNCMNNLKLQNGKYMHHIYCALHNTIEKVNKYDISKCAFRVQEIQ